MSDKMKEEISAMMDDESSMFGVRRALSEMEDDKELHDSWERYHFVRATIQQSSLCQPSMAERVRAGLDNENPANFVSAASGERAEPAHLKPRSRYSQNFASIAVAASVAFMTVFGWQYYQSVQNPAFTSVSESRVALIEQNPVAEKNTTLAYMEKGQKPILDVTDTLILSDMPIPGLQSASSGSFAMNQSKLVRPSLSNVDALILKKLDLYLSNHAEHAALNTGRGMLPLARTVNYSMDGNLK